MAHPYDEPSPPKKPNVSKYSSWTPEDVVDFFMKHQQTTGIYEEAKLKSLLQTIYGKEESIDGKKLDKLTEDMIYLNVHQDEAYDDDLANSAEKILLLVKSLRQQQYNICTDPIHGPIMLHPLIVKIVDTPEFQRLRNIKQLGGTCYVFPGATHTRFDHSLGVYHLAGELARSLKQNQPELEITDEDVLCVQIAGLCHDLGHGPFSRMFETYVAQKLVQQDEWKHESTSKIMFDAIHKKKEEDFKHYGLKKEDILFIQEQLEGKHPSKGHDVIKGRNEKKYFLYEIVANKRNGMDVDKWDYFARDCHYLGITNEFQWRRCLKLARVAAPKDNPEDLQICMPEKEVGHIYSMFHTRCTLHQRVYKHKTTRVIEHMISHAFILVADVKLLHIPNPNDAASSQESVTLREAVCNLKDKTSGFLQLTDNFVGQIMCTKYTDNEWETGQLKKAQELLQRIEQRQLYRFVTHATVLPKAAKSQLERLKRDNLSEVIVQGTNLKCFAEVVTVSYSSEKKQEDDATLDTTDETQHSDVGNPLDDVMFYSKSDPWEAKNIDQKTGVSQLVVPRRFIETQVRVYNKKSQAEKRDNDELRRAFQKWLEKPENENVFENCIQT